MNTEYDAAQAGQALYHAAWEAIRDNFFARERLHDWHTWEHRFDSEIVDEASALEFCDQMLASLNDPYTTRLVAPEAATQEESAAKPAKKLAPVFSDVSSDNLGYLRILDFSAENIFEQVQAAAEKIKDCDGIMLDLRFNSGGRMHRAIQTASLFSHNGLIASVEWPTVGGSKRREYYVNEDQFFCVETSVEGEENTESYERPPALLANQPVVLLLHRRTASAAELLACSVIENSWEGRIATVGGTTAGKGIGQSIFPLMDGRLVLQITTSRWYSPSGGWVGDCSQTVSNGISSDIEVTGDTGDEGLLAAAKKLRAMLGRAPTTQPQ